MRRATLLLAALLLTGCGATRHTPPAAKSQGADPRAAGAATSQVLYGLVRDGTGVIVVHHPGSVAFHDSGGFDSAVAAFERDAHARRVLVDGLPGAIGFRIPHAAVEASIEHWNREYLKRGAYVFRYLDTGGYSAEGDGVLVLPTRDPWAVIRAAGVNGIGYGLDTPAVVDWLRKLDALHHFTVYGAGADFVEGRFASAPTGQDALILARSMYSFDPDIVDQGTGTVEALARVLEQTGTLYLWWD